MKQEVHRFEQLDDLNHAVAAAVARTINAAVHATGKCSIALSGGSTPIPIHRLLASQFRDAIPWGNVHVFWGDDRYVPGSHASSNFRMAKETLLDHVPCPAANVHPMPTGFADPADAAAAYEATMRTWFTGEWPRFDLMILGIGADGHTASLFPGSAALNEKARWAVAVTAPAEPPTRLTLTLPVLNRCAHAWFVVTGSGKAHAVQQALSGTADPATHPAAGVAPEAGEVTWWLDREAASALPGQDSP